MKQCFSVIIMIIVASNIFAQNNHTISEQPIRYGEKEKVFNDSLFNIELKQGVFMEMIRVNGGSFSMGYSKGYTNELPIHKVTLDTFYIGKYEITQKVWLAVMGSNPAHFKYSDQCPVEMVSYYDIEKFIEKINLLTGLQFRLPTEAEWEFAAIGGEKGKRTRYAGSYKINEVAWYNRNSDEKTHPVGEKEPNELAIYDMSGNVYEWTQDWHKRYKAKDQNNPTGPEKGKDKVIRGGCWHDDRDACRVHCRVEMNPGKKNGCLGFRLVLSKYNIKNNKL